MSIMITGAFGFLGSNLCYDFLKQEKEVVAYDLVYRIPKYLKRYEKDKNLIFVRGDITDSWHLMESVKKYGVTEIIHTATLMNDKASYPQPHRFLKTNISGGINVLEAARIFNLRKLITISTRAAYGSYAPEEGPLTEQAVLKPIGFYGASKASIDLILPIYRNYYNIDAVSIRSTGIFGPGQGEEGTGHLGITATIYQILTSVLNGKPFILPIGGDHYLEFCYVKDLVKGIRKILETDHLQRPIYNICYGSLLSIAEIGKMIKELLPKSEIQIGPGILKDIELRAALDISQARKEWGYEPTPLKECIEDYIHYLTS